MLNKSAGVSGDEQVADQLFQLCSDLYPLCRSITGNGVRLTLEQIQKHIPVAVHEVPTGTAVFDWAVPREWNIKDAFIKNKNGERIVDFRKSNLHVVGYSTPIRKTVTLEELKAHVYTIPEHPEWIPYRTSYYTERWGFCMSHRQLAELQDADYEVCIDASLENGQLTYGELFIAGQTNDEVLLSCHICHPSLANDNLSGIAIATFLAKHLSSSTTRYSYRFLFIPGTIGSITWLALNEERAASIKHGLILACLGDAGGFSYKKSRMGNAEIDKAVSHVLGHSGESHTVLDFSPYGYDERQFCSPGFNLPVGCLMRTPHGKFPEYHTSADDLEFIKAAKLAESFSHCVSILDVLEKNKRYLNQNPKCEPQLGKRGLYRGLGGQTDTMTTELAMLWVLNLSDGQHSLLDIAEKSGIEFGVIGKAADLLAKHDLLKAIEA